MQLHANAAVSLIKRRQMVCAGARAGVDDRRGGARRRDQFEDLWEVGVPLPSGRRVRFAGSQLGAEDCRQPHLRAADRGDRRVAQVAVHGPGDRRGARMPLSTVSGILTRIGMGRLGRLGLEPAERYERARPGELVHIDVKKLGRIARPGHRVLGRQSAGGHHRRRYEQGWEFVHVAVDDCTRLAYVEVLPDETRQHRDRLSCAAPSRSTVATASASSA